MPLDAQRAPWRPARDGTDTARPKRGRRNRAIPDREEDPQQKLRGKRKPEPDPIHQLCESGIRLGEEQQDKRQQQRGQNPSHQNSGGEAVRRRIFLRGPDIRVHSSVGLLRFFLSANGCRRLLCRGIPAKKTADGAKNRVKIAEWQPHQRVPEISQQHPIQSASKARAKGDKRPISGEDTQENNGRKGQHLRHPPKKEQGKGEEKNSPSQTAPCRDVMGGAQIPGYPKR